MNYLITFEGNDGHQTWSKHQHNSLLDFEGALNSYLSVFRDGYQHLAGTVAYVRPCDYEGAGFHRIGVFRLEVPDPTPACKVVKVNRY